MEGVYLIIYFEETELEFFSALFPGIIDVDLCKGPVKPSHPFPPLKSRM